MLPYAPWLTWLIPLVVAILIPIFDKIHEKLRDYIAVLSVATSAVFAISLIPDIFAGRIVDVMSGKTISSTIPYDWTINWLPLGDLNGDKIIDYLSMGVLVDPLSVFMVNIVSIIGLLIMIYSLGYMHGEKDMRRYWFWMNFFIGSMILLVSADNLILMFYGWEMVGICSWQLIAFWFKSDKPSPVPGFDTEGEYNAHCGMKAFITTSFGDIFMLVAIALIGFATAAVNNGIPVFNFIQLESLAANESTSWISIISRWGLISIFPIFLFMGPVGKSAQFPLHEWLPEAMAGPTTVSALIHAATMVKAGVYFVARILPIFYLALSYEHGINIFFTTVAWIGAFTAFLAASQGMVAKELKKILAYSTISQLGYMMLALGSAGYAAEMAYSAFTAGTFHLMAHAIFKALLFLCAGAILHETGTKFVHEMGGLKDAMPITYKTMLIGGLSLAGIPPFAGYFSKELIFSTLFEIELWPIFVIAAVSAIMTVFYTFRMIGLVFFGEKSEYLKQLEAKGKTVHEAPLVMTGPLMILAALTVISGFLEPLFKLFFMNQLKILGFSEMHNLNLAFQEFIVHSFTAPTTLITAVVIILGFVPAYKLYIQRTLDAEKIVNSNALMKSLYTFLYNRWYINDIYYVIVRGAFSAGQRIRRIQTGQVNMNVIGMLLGFIAFLLYFILFM
ncbi:MAG: NADH-quinone oxidoreductase subunit L [Candidatus Asgardarchaeia archaeon]